MRKIFLRWLLDAVPLIFLVSLVTFILSSLVPGDLGRVILGYYAPEADVARLNDQLGMNLPLPVRYVRWLASALQGDLGYSVTSGVPVARMLTDRLGITITMVLGALVVAAVVGITLGVVSALRGGRLGRMVDAISVLGMAIPNFWFALVMVMVFAVDLSFFPATGVEPWPFAMILPIVTLGLSTTAPVVKQTRDGVLLELGRDYVQMLRARGVPESTIIIRHVLRNAAAPIITVLGVLMVSLFGGSVLIESVFVIPGLGGLVVFAANTHDIPAVQGVALAYTLMILLATLLTELLYVVVNPRLRA
jgi:peptide/nickel transport system permease protein